MGARKSVINEGIFATRSLQQQLFQKSEIAREVCLQADNNLFTGCKHPSNYKNKKLSIVSLANHNIAQVMHSLTNPEPIFR